MNAPLELRHEEGRHVDILHASGQLLWRYVYCPATPAHESPRPYAHPVYSVAGDLLTNFRPHDHPWHHALSLALTTVDEVNFWGGPTYRAGVGYAWKDNHGTQRHREWFALEPARLGHTLEWIDQHSGRVLLTERRTLRTVLENAAWHLHWTSELQNVAGKELVLGNYEAVSGLSGSHYTGLQFRGARDLLDDYGDTSIGVLAEGVGTTEASVHGAVAPAMEWACRHDGSLRRTRIRFEGNGDVRWFVRRKNPVAAFSFNRGQLTRLPPTQTLHLDHTLHFTSQS